MKKIISLLVFSIIFISFTNNAYAKGWTEDYNNENDYDIITIAFDWYPISSDDDEYIPSQLLFIGKDDDGNPGSFTLRLTQTPIANEDGGFDYGLWNIDQEQSSITTDDGIVTLFDGNWIMKNNTQLEMFDENIELSSTDEDSYSFKDLKCNSCDTFNFNNSGSERDMAYINGDEAIEDFKSTIKKYDIFDELKNHNNIKISDGSCNEGSSDSITGCVAAQMNDDDAGFDLNINDGTGLSILYMDGTSTSNADGKIKILENHIVTAEEDIPADHPGTSSNKYISSLERLHSGYNANHTQGVLQNAVCSLQDSLDGKCNEKIAKINSANKNLQQFTLGNIESDEAQRYGSGVNSINFIGNNIDIGGEDKKRITNLEEKQEMGIIKEAELIELKELKSKTGLGSIENIIQKIISYGLGFIEGIATLILIYGALLWITSAGDDEKVSKGRTVILWSAIGLVITVLAHIIITIVIQIVGSFGS